MRTYVKFTFANERSHVSVEVEPLSTSRVRDWSKSIGGGGPEQRRGGSRGFEPCRRGESCNFQLSLGGGSPYFIT